MLVRSGGLGYSCPSIPSPNPTSNPFTAFSRSVPAMICAYFFLVLSPPIPSAPSRAPTLREKRDPSEAANAHVQKRRVFQTARRGRQQRVPHLAGRVEHAREREIALVHDASRGQILVFREGRNEKSSRVFCEQRGNVVCFAKMERQGRVAVPDEWIGLHGKKWRKRRFRERRSRCGPRRLREWSGWDGEKTRWGRVLCGERAASPSSAPRRASRSAGECGTPRDRRPACRRAESERRRA